MKTARQIINAAKRQTRPKTSTSGSKSQPSNTGTSKPVEITLPDLVTEISILSNTTIRTNRAPLVLAFALTALSFSPHPIQPLDSRLSLAQGVVALNSRTKANSIGIESGKTAEQEGWGEGFGRINVLGRDVPTVRRTSGEQDGSAVWAVDLDALRKRNFSFSGSGPVNANVAIHTPQAARSYLLKSFDRVEGENTAKEREENAAMVLGALEKVMRTWKENEVHGRAWSGYVKVRPDVAGGAAGWGAKGEVKLRDILTLATGELE
jgi:hypothetical protein